MIVEQNSVLAMVGEEKVTMGTELDLVYFKVFRQ